MANERSEKPGARAGARESTGRNPDERSRRREADEEPRAPHGDPTGEHGDQMPRGADEPGAGL